MALDLRRSNTSSCRRWIEKVLLQLEGMEITRFDGELGEESRAEVGG